MINLGSTKKNYSSFDNNEIEEEIKKDNDYATPYYQNQNYLYSGIRPKLVLDGEYERYEEYSEDEEDEVQKWFTLPESLNESCEICRKSTTATIYLWIILLSIIAIAALRGLYVWITCKKHNKC